MSDRPPLSQEPRTGATKVVTGPVGSARLVEPSHLPDLGVDPQELPGAAMPNPTPDQDGQPDPREAPPAATDETARD